MKERVMSVLLAVLMLLISLMPAVTTYAQDWDDDDLQVVDLDEAEDAAAAEYFLLPSDEPIIEADADRGTWLYVDDEIRLTITRHQSQTPLMTWYIADIRLNEGVSMYTETYNTKHYGRTNALPQDLARTARAVYAQSGDFYSYRVAKDRYPGIILRDGSIIYKKTYSKYVRAVPNLATMAFYPDGSAQVNESYEVSAKEYKKKGAETVLAFGPLLVRDGVTADLSDDAYTHLEPRSCLGMIENSHFVGLLVEGRKKHSDGATLGQCARILQEYGCRIAINLDGGNTAAMLFMGQSVQLGENGEKHVNDRAVPDIIAFGKY